MLNNGHPKRAPAQRHLAVGVFFAVKGCIFPVANFSGYLDVSCVLHAGSVKFVDKKTGRRTFPCKGD